MFCKNCGKEIEEKALFCSGCGSATGLPQQETVTQIGQGTVENTIVSEEFVGPKTRRSYIFSILGTAISFFIRIATQSKHVYWDSLLDNLKVMGIDREAKPFVTFIPAIAAVIVALMIVSDKETSVQKKKTAFVVNAVIIALALVFIWLDIPYQIFDF